MTNDSLYRISIKCLIFTNDGRVLVVKERGRKSWDLPGGGIDHGESIQAAIKRELYEECSFSGDFTYRVIDMDDPVRLRTRNIWQARVIVEVVPDNFNFTTGVESDEIGFTRAEELKNSKNEPEQNIYNYIARYRLLHA